MMGLFGWALIFIGLIIQAQSNPELNSLYYEVSGPRSPVSRDLTREDKETSMITPSSPWWFTHPAFSTTERIECLKQHETCNHTTPCCPPNLWCDMNSKPTGKHSLEEYCGTCQPHPWIARDGDDDKASSKTLSTTFAPYGEATSGTKPKSCIHFLSKCDPNERTTMCCENAPFCESGFCTHCLFHGSKCTSSSQCCSGTPHCIDGTCSTSKKTGEKETRKATTAAETTLTTIETTKLTTSTTVQTTPTSTTSKKKPKSQG